MARTSYPALRVASIVLLIAIWAALVRFGVYRFGFIPSPWSVLVAAAAYVTDRDFFLDAASSIYRVLAAWGASAVIGIPLGLLIGWKRWFSELTFPIVELLRPIPPIAWIPAGILFFPQIELSVIFICFIGSFFPIVLNTIAGVKQIDRTCSGNGHKLDGAGRRRNDRRRTWSRIHDLGILQSGPLSAHRGRDDRDRDHRCRD